MACDPMSPGPNPPQALHADPGQAAPAPRTVETVLTLRMQANGRRRTSFVPTRFRYDPAEPFAVRLAFHVGEPDEAEWVFARELLADGLHGPSGQGDIKVWPAHCPEHGQVVRLALQSPHGTALLEAVATQVQEWLLRGYALVPPGAEVSRFPSDEELARLAQD